MFSTEISKRKWNNCLGCRRRKVKPTEEPKKGKRQRAERGRMNPSLEGRVLPLPWQVLGQALVFLGSDLFFQKVSESSVCCRVTVWGSVLHLTSWQDGSVEIWISWNMDRVPHSAKPCSSSCPAVIKAWIHAADALMGGRSVIVPRPPGFVSAGFPGPSVRGRGAGGGWPGGAGSAEPSPRWAGVINNAEWILASLGAEKIIPSWNWASARGHGTLETAGLELLKGRALENWVSHCVCLISSPAHWKIEKSIGLLLLGLKWLFFLLFFFSFQLMFYWILRKVDLQVPPQRRGERNKYKIFRLGSEEEAGLDGACAPPEKKPLPRPQEQPEVTTGKSLVCAAPPGGFL